MQAIREINGQWENVSRFENPVSTTITPEQVMVIMKDFFGITRDFEDYEDLVCFIQDDVTIDWDEVSKNQKIPVFIMEEFAEMFNWFNIVSHRIVTKHVVKKFSKRIQDVLSKPNFLNKYDGKPNVAKFMINVMGNDFIKKAMIYCDKKSYFDSFRIMCTYLGWYSLQDLCHYKNILATFKFNAPTIDLFNEAIKCKQSHIVKAILVDGRIVPTDEQLTSAIKSNHHQTVDAILNDGRVILTDEHLSLAVKNCNPEVVKIFLQNSQIQLTEDHLLLAIGSKYDGVLSEVLRDGRIIPTDIALSRAIEMNSVTKVNIILQRGSFLDDSHLTKAIKSGSPSIVDALLQNLKFRPTKNHLDIAINKFLESKKIYRLSYDNDYYRGDDKYIEIFNSLLQNHPFQVYDEYLTTAIDLKNCKLVEILLKADAQPTDFQLTSLIDTYINGDSYRGANVIYKIIETILKSGKITPAVHHMMLTKNCYYGQHLRSLIQDAMDN